jgi:hypothetical protein
MSGRDSTRDVRFAGGETRRLRLGDHGKHRVLLEGRDLMTSDLSRRQRLSFLRIKIVIPLSLPSRIFSCLLGQPNRIGGPKLGGHIPSRPVLTPETLEGEHVNIALHLDPAPA